MAATSVVLVTESKLGSGYLFCYVTAENWNITIRFNFICHMWNNPSDIHSIFKKYPQQQYEFVNCMTYNLMFHVKH